MSKLDQTKINNIIKSYIKESLEFDETFRINQESVVTDDQINKMVKATVQHTVVAEPQKRIKIAKA